MVLVASNNFNLKWNSIGLVRVAVFYFHYLFQLRCKFWAKSVSRPDGSRSTFHGDTSALEVLRGALPVHSRVVVRPSFSASILNFQLDPNILLQFLRADNRVGNISNSTIKDVKRTRRFRISIDFINSFPGREGIIKQLNGDWSEEVEVIDME